MWFGGYPVDCDLDSGVIVGKFNEIIFQFAPATTMCCINGQCTKTAYASTFTTSALDFTVDRYWIGGGEGLSGVVDSVEIRIDDGVAITETKKGLAFASLIIFLITALAILAWKYGAELSNPCYDSHDRTSVKSPTVNNFDFNQTTQEGYTGSNTTLSSNVVPPPNPPGVGMTAFSSGSQNFRKGAPPPPPKKNLW